MGNPGSLAALFLLGILSDIGVPLFFVLETFLFLASYYAGPLSTHVLVAVLILLIGNECGAAILYWISSMSGNTVVGWLRKRSSRMDRDYGQFRSRLNKRTVMAVAMVRLTPGLLQVPSLVAGAMRLPYLRFIVGVAIASLIYDLAFILLGFLARIGLRNVAQDMRAYFIFGLIFVFIAIVIWLAVQHKGRQ